MSEKTYALGAETVHHYLLTVRASSAKEAKTKAIEGKAECSDLLDVELKVGKCREIEP